MRVEHQSKIDELKKQIICTNSVGKRIDGCKGAIERAQQRQAAAVAKLAEAEEARNNAAEDIHRLQSELAELEASVSSQQAQAEEGSRIKRMQTEMSRVLADMNVSGNVAPQEIQTAVANMNALFKSIVQIQQAAQNRAAGDGSGSSGVPVNVSPSVLDMLRAPPTVLTIAPAEVQMGVQGGQPADGTGGNQLPADNSSVGFHAGGTGTQMQQ